MTTKRRGVPTRQSIAEDFYTEKTEHEEVDDGNQEEFEGTSDS